MIRTVILSIGIISTVSFAQQVDTTSKQLPEQQVVVSSEIKQPQTALKKTIGVQPRPSTNWSKIKDLFL